MKMRENAARAARKNDMKSILKISLSLLAAGAFTASAATDTVLAASSNATPSLSDLLPDVIVAKGNGFEIRQSQLDRAVLNAKENAAQNGQQVSPEMMPTLEKQALDDMMLMKLLNGVATDEQKQEGRLKAETNFTEFKKQWPTEDLMVAKLKGAGMTPEALQSNLTEQATAETVLLGRVKVTPDDIKKFYDDHPSDMKEDEEAEIAFITMGGPDPVTRTPLAEDQKAAKKKEIEGVRDRARNGEDFSKLVHDYSEDTASKPQDGKITLIRGMQGIPPEFETAAFSLKTNEVSDVIVTPYGFHIIKLISHTPERNMTLEEATPHVQRYLQALDIRKMLPEYFVELKKGANVEILDPKLKAMDDAAAKSGPAESIDSLPPAKSGAGE
jgi:parvulin-like peptidyl-prolyl isomerase